MKRGIVLIGLIGALAVMGAGIAVAGVSDGNYRPARQGCTGHADDSDHPDQVEQGCQSLTFNVSDGSSGSSHEPLRVGTQQTADGQDAGPPTVDTSGGDQFDPTTGVRVYFGADDNLDHGEHDSSEQIGDGPSDGGAVVVNIAPDSITKWIGALMSGDESYLLTHPVPGADAGFGSCADGVCESVQTQRRVAYQGGGKGSRDAADYDGYNWDPQSCGGPSDTAADCGKGGIRRWWKHDGTVYVEPGVQVYEDPNPEGSPIGPYPLPGVYAGTCGVEYSSGHDPAVVVPTGC